MSWPYGNDGFTPVIRWLAATDTWQCLVKFRDREFTSVNNGQSYPTPDEALAAATASIAALIQNRKEAIAIEVVRFLIEERLRSTLIDDPQNPGTEIRVWQAKRDDGTWAEWKATPQAAVLDALGRTE